MDNLVFSLSTKEAEVIVTALANMPYKDSAPVINKVMQQVQEQQKSKKEDPVDE